MVRQVTPTAVAAMIARGDPLLLVDVRQPEEYAFCHLAGSVLIPIGELTVRATEMDPNPGTLVVVVCHHGVRSYKAAAFLAQAGVENVASLAGGVEAWSLTVDAGLPRY